MLPLELDENSLKGLLSPFSSLISYKPLPKISILSYSPFPFDIRFLLWLYFLFDS
jgi:hypothetical protein